MLELQGRNRKRFLQVLSIYHSQTTIRCEYMRQNHITINHSGGNFYVYEKESVLYDEPVRPAAEQGRQLIKRVLFIIPQSGGKCNAELSKESDAGCEFRQCGISQARQ